MMHPRCLLTRRAASASARSVPQNRVYGVADRLATPGHQASLNADGSTPGGTAREVANEYTRLPRRQGDATIARSCLAGCLRPLARLPASGPRGAVRTVARAAADRGPPW